MTLTAGTRLGPYEILAPIGAGGMGEVYSARDTRLARTVAVKVLPDHLSKTPEVRQRFEREARTISQLSHAHICAIFDVGREGETEYLVMEYLEGETLSERLARGALPLDLVLRCGMEIADALDKAHRQGIVHRDLKPGNVMLTRSGVKLLDFGLAKSFERSPDSAERTQGSAGHLPGLTSIPTVAGNAPLTQEGTILGTFQYMAPEQLEGKEADSRTDIFALGTVLYETATGKKAFSGATQASLISSVLRDDPPPISQTQPMSPIALDRVVKTCLAKDPEERWQSAGDLRRELRWITEGSQASGAHPEGARTVSGTARRRARGGLLGWIAAGLLLLGALYLGNELRRARAVRPAPMHSFLIPPAKTTFALMGDQSAPMVLSPDGANVAFGAGGKLWVQSLRTGAASGLPSTDGASFPFWSPDARSVGFFADGKLKTIEASGGPVQVVCDAPTPRGGTWNSAGVIVFTPDFRGGLFRVPASGGTPVELTKVDPAHHTTHRWPFFLPDGNHVLYLAANHANPRSEESGIYLVALDAPGKGGAPRRVMASYGAAQYASGYILTARDGSLIASAFDLDRLAVSGPSTRVSADVAFDYGIWRGVFSASQTGLLAFESASEGRGGLLTWFDASGRLLSTIGERTESYALKLSPDGRRASVILGDPNNDIWIWELERGMRTRLTTDAQVIMSPVWSPDGSEIIYVTGRSFEKTDVEYKLSRLAANGAGEPKALYTSTERIEPTDWSRDGRYVLLDRGTIGATDIWAVPVANPDKAFALVKSPALDGSGVFSPDGRWVAYFSQQAGRFEIYVTSFPAGGARWQVSAHGGLQPQWSRDGQTLYFVSLENPMLMAAAVDGKGSQFVVNDVKPLFPVNLFLGPRTSDAYAVTPDGKRVLINSAGDLAAPRVALVANWPAEIGK